MFPTVPPTVAKRSRDKVTVVEGNALYLLCEAEGNPTPLVTWKKQGKLLQSRFNETNFIVHEARNTDAGIYECKASNSVGSVSYKVEVTIKPKGEVTLCNLPSFPRLNFSISTNAECLLHNTTFPRASDGSRSDDCVECSRFAPVWIIPPWNIDRLCTLIRSLSFLNSNFVRRSLNFSQEFSNSGSIQRTDRHMV